MKNKVKQITLIYCFLIGIIQVNASNCPLIKLEATAVSCFNGVDGKVTATLTNGTGLYSYTWSSGTSGIINSNGATVTISGKAAGVYTIYVVDLNTGCTSTNAIAISQPLLIDNEIVITPVLCKSGNTGKLQCTTLGGITPYTYKWNTGSTSATLSNIPQGKYTVIITDKNGCKAYDTALITQPMESLQSSISGTNISCSGKNDGMINLSTWGGTSPYTYNWNSGSYFSEDINKLTAGNYSVIIRDKNNCTASNTLNLTEPTPLLLSLTHKNIECAGNSTGNIYTTVSGGTKPYNYTWVNSNYTLNNLANLDNIIADTYTVTTTDKNGCSIVKSVTLTEPPKLLSTISGTNVKCYGGNDGKIDLEPTGGQMPYTYKWETTTSALPYVSQDLTSIPSTEYFVTITDDLGCTTLNKIYISQPNSPLSIELNAKNILCYGENTGSITSEIKGGTEPFSILWSNNETTTNINNLFSGLYIINVTDINACVNSKSINVSQPLAPLSSSAFITAVRCNGENNGAIDLTVNGGTSPYYYTWQNKQFTLSTTSQDLDSIVSNDYVVFISDQNNCRLTDSFLVKEPDLLNLQFKKTHIGCTGMSTGIIEPVLSGGTSPFSYSWSNGNTQKINTNIPASKYIVTITDLNNCTISDSTVLIEPKEALTSYFKTTDVTCPGGSDGLILYNVEGGTIPYKFSWSNQQTTRNIYDLTAGNYIITVTDLNNCTLTNLITINQPANIVITASTTNVSCFKYKDGGLDITVSGGTIYNDYTYQWSNSQYLMNAVTQDINELYADIYTVFVTDLNGCTGNASFNVIEPQILGATDDVVNITCAGGSNGSITVDVSGGTTTYSYQWSNGDTQKDLINIPIGIYTVTVTDAHNCSIVLNAELIEPKPITFTETVTEVTCVDQHDGTILLYPEGGMGGYSYSWSTGTFENPLINQRSGLYSITITDIVGCTKMDTITIPLNEQECINIPNIISPNGDGINDYWNIKNIFLYPECMVIIYNQWGQIIWESKGYATAWDGTKNGKQVASSTYYYIIELGDSKPKYTGDLTVIY